MPHFQRHNHSQWHGIYGILTVILDVKLPSVECPRVKRTYNGRANMVMPQGLTRKVPTSRTACQCGKLRSENNKFPSKAYLKR